MWENIKVRFGHSVTILWARIVTLGGAVLAALLSLSVDPDVSGAIQSVLRPKFIPYYVIAIGLVTELARRRTVNRQTDASNKVID